VVLEGLCDAGQLCRHEKRREAVGVRREREGRGVDFGSLKIV
jgi:hypothetical protein